MGKFVKIFQQVKTPAGSATGHSENVIDGKLLKIGDVIVLGVPAKTHGDAVPVLLYIENANLTVDVLNAMYPAPAAENVFVIVDVIHNSQYSQGDPRSNRML